MGWYTHLLTDLRNEKSILSIIFRETTLDIQHFGSTSVPGMLAKPIIDILIGIRTLELDSSITVAIEQLGYEGFGEAGVEDGDSERVSIPAGYGVIIRPWVVVQNLKTKVQTLDYQETYATKPNNLWIHSTSETTGNISTCCFLSIRKASNSFTPSYVFISVNSISNWFLICMILS